MITVTINGRARAFERELPLPELIERLAITFPRIAVAHNGTVLRQEEHATTVVRDGDTLEIVRMVGGG
jgi:sulfur carrier protein